ncbi:hypothetical protein CNMCM5793_003201 [Aspergillus hiratsukae]|uniref:Uncharacterized protein n=1 Tax=Aspergillus hiratsukae TaxID=1194566 RepID=A0A8H6PDL9_9EURO|nr:hypothetical protein CNMCM5793_003201 [Aspergillus hiratsukae]KAF7168168.1 hypothetical protein CNMCM6106_003458 [Aspergillus hiratsukae]
MPNPKQVRTREAVLQCLPPLLRGPHHTKSSAIHRLKFVGPLRQWANFLEQVIQTDQGEVWSPRIIKYTQQARDLEAETVLVPDEHGVQGRFQQSVGQVVGKILDAQGINAHFADFKCIGGAYHNTPDAILMNGNALEAIGELKVPWVDKHVIADAYDDEDRALRVLLAQPIQYMQDLNCMYGFLTNYDETIFIKQSLINGAWVVDYSPVIRASTTFVKPEPGNPLTSSMVLVKQCFFHLASIAHGSGPVINTTPKPQWVIAT